MSPALLGAPGSDLGGNDTGAVYLFLGPVTADTDVAAADATFYGWNAWYLGESMAGPGDVDGDGFDDLLMNQYVNREDSKVRLFFGLLAGTREFDDADVTLVDGDGIHDDAGHALAGAGDVDRDDFDDFLVGAPSSESDTTLIGAAWLVRGGLGF
ncbi:MAG: FG-GAP repeat protein [Deltaproteobacteria bacterium]|nr:FG-GAP repeat protein [Deltaproteobacteria bacterium]